MNLAGIFLTRFVLGLRRWTPLPLFLPLTSSWENCLPRLQCNPHTIQNQLLTFGKGGAAARKSKWGRVIKPNPPAIAARMAPGSGPAPLGRRFKDRRGEVVTLTGGQVARAGNPPVYPNRRPHNLTLVISDNARSAI